MLLPTWNFYEHIERILLLQCYFFTQRALLKNSQRFRIIRSWLEFESLNQTMNCFKLYKNPLSLSGSKLKLSIKRKRNLSMKHDYERNLIILRLPFVSKITIKITIQNLHFFIADKCILLLPKVFAESSLEEVL